MGMRPRLDRRVTVLRAGLIDDGFGLSQGPFEAVGELWAQRRDVSDAEKFAAGRLQATVTTRFTVRNTGFARTVTAGDRLLCEGDEFNIVGIKQTEHRGTYLEISAVTGGL
jgi:SPP1 family predicted phage head-tail adaptor